MNAALLEQLEAFPAEIAAFYLDLQSGACWSWHAEDDFPAASVVKVPILLTVYRAAQSGTLSLDTRVAVEGKHHVGGAGVLYELHEGVEVTLEDLCRLMIVVSDNVASNMLLDLVGMPAVNELMTSLEMYRSNLGRRFMQMARPGADNRTCAYDMALCLAALQSGQVLDEEHTAAALAILRRQQYREKIPALLPPELSVAHKTGELDGVRHDVALVEVPEQPYVLALLTQKGGGAHEVDGALARLSRLVYEQHLDATTT